MVQIASLETADVGQLRRELIREIIKSMGLSDSGWSGRLLGSVFWLPVHRFSTWAAHFDRRTAEEGLPAAASWLLSRFVAGVRVWGREVIPAHGPLVIASNHPGAVDGLCITANLPRNDTKVIVTGIPFFHSFRAGRDHMIYVPREGPGRMGTMREMLRHLERGGSLLIFPSGNVDPDPAFLPGASEALTRWSPSLELIIRRMPDTQVLLTMVSGVLSPKWMKHPLVRLQRTPRDMQRLAEILQTVQQIIFGRKLPFHPRVTFGQPMTAAELPCGGGTQGLMPCLVERAQALLREHLVSAQAEAG